MELTWWPKTREDDLATYLSDEDLAALRAHQEDLSFARGTTIMRRGTPSDSVYFVREGSVEVLDEAMGEPVVLARVGPSGVFGEVGFVDGRDRTQDVVAATDCRLLRLRREAFIRLRDAEPVVFAKLAIALAELLARRFRSAVDEIRPVRAFAASLHEPMDLGAPRFDEVEEALPEDAAAVIRRVAAHAAKDLAGT